MASYFSFFKKANSITFLHLPLFFFVIISCSETNEFDSKINREDLKIYFTSYLRESDSLATVDSFRYIYYRPITEKELLQGQLVTLVDLIQAHTESMELNLQLLEAQKNTLQLYSGIDPVLYRMKRREIEKTESDFEKASDEINDLVKRHDSLEKIQLVADSITPKLYQAVCFFQVRYPDRSVKKDSSYIILNSDFNIVKQ